MDINHIFRSGKYQGYTVGEVSEVDYGYLMWVKENRPEMLRSAKPKPQKITPPQMSEEDIETYNWNKNIRPASPEEAF